MLIFLYYEKSWTIRVPNNTYQHVGAESKKLGPMGSLHTGYLLVYYLHNAKPINVLYKN